MWSKLVSSLAAPKMYPTSSKLNISLLLTASSENGQVGPSLVKQGIFICLSGAACASPVEKLPHQCSKLAHEKFYLTFVVLSFIICQER